MNISQMFTTALVVSPANEPAAVTVVITGLVLVFAVLILLYALISVQGKIFGSIDKKKLDKANAAAGIVHAPAAPVAKIASPCASPAAYIAPGISGEVVAAITCAIASMDGGYTMRSLTKDTSRTRSAWGRAGISANTEPF